MNLGFLEIRCSGSYKVPGEVHKCRHASSSWCMCYVSLVLIVRAFLVLV